MLNNLLKSLKDGARVLARIFATAVVTGAIGFVVGFAGFFFLRWIGRLF